MEYKIPHAFCNLDDKIFKGKNYKVVKCQQQQISKYRVKCNNNPKRKEYIFFFTADIIDIVLNYYKVPFIKEAK